MNKGELTLQDILDSDDAMHDLTSNQNSELSKL